MSSAISRTWPRSEIYLLQSLALGAQRMHALFVGKVVDIKKKASGRNISETERGTERLNLRLKPSVMQKLYSLSTECSDKPGTPLAYAKVIEEALEALSREMDREVLEDLDNPERCDCHVFEEPHFRCIAGCVHDKGPGAVKR